MKQEVRNEKVLGSVTGLYSQGIRCGECVYTTQIGTTRSGAFAGESAYDQAVQVLKNAESLLAGVGASLKDVVKCTIYLVDMADYEALNRAYAEWMPKPYPVRACVQVAGLSPGSRVEMEFTAHIGHGT